jgi:hypothetical protein
VYKLVGYFLCSRSLEAFSLNLQNIILGIYSLFLQTLQNGTEESVCFVVFSFLCVTVYSDSSFFLKSIAYTLCFSLRGLTPNPATFETGYHQPLSFGASDSSHYRAIAWCSLKISAYPIESEVALWWCDLLGWRSINPLFLSVWGLLSVSVSVSLSHARAPCSTYRELLFEVTARSLLLFSIFCCNWFVVQMLWSFPIPGRFDLSSLP